MVDDESQVKIALEKASEAQSSAKNAYEKVQNALDSVRDIQLALNNLDAISKDYLSFTCYMLRIAEGWT